MDNSRTLERMVKWVVLALGAYWLVYSTVVPVTGWDSQTHDLARLLIADQGGLFGNHGWNMSVQDFFPWSFDAVHYPFFFIGFGYALPSFACFVGMMIIIFRLVRQSYSEAAAWWCCFAMLALPTLMYQASTTKNDMAIAFGVACWYYALRYWLRERKNIYLALMALALGFTAGAKSSGVPVVALLSLYTFQQIGWNKSTLIRFCAYLAAGLVLMGSSEIYVYNIKTYGHILGPPDVVQEHVNRDGLPGAASNAIRYFYGLMNAVVDVANQGGSPFPHWLADNCREVLRFTNLANLGYFHTYNDSTLVFMKDGVEASSDYGPVGMLALFCSLWVVLTWRTRDPVWKIAALGFLNLGMICYTTAWQPWCNRFLIVPVVLFTLAFMLWAVGRTDAAFYRRAAKPLFLLLLFSAVLFPWFSYNRGPRFVRLSIVHRDEMIARERPDMLEIIKDIKSIPRRDGPAFVLLHAAPDSWVLAILQIPFSMSGLHVMPAPELTPEIYKTACEKAAGQPVYVLVLNRPLAPDAGKNLVLVKQYAAQNCSLLKLQELANPSAQTHL